MEPTIEYESISFFPSLGFIGYTADSRMFYLDEKTGEIIGETSPTGGFGDPYVYGYYPDSMTFFYNLEYEYLPEDGPTVIEKSESMILCVYELEQTEWRYDYKENGKCALYYNGRFVSDFIYDWVVGGNEIALVRYGGKYGILDVNQTVFNFKY